MREEEEELGERRTEESRFQTERERAEEEED
jgi:hypothetical protein